jgi:DNA-binding beta-propeller fold protein YncE
MKRSLKIALWIAALLLAAPAFAQLSVPEIPFDSAPDFLNTGDAPQLGEAAGVATNSKGHLFVFTRSGSTNVTLGTNRVLVRGGARLYEYDQNGKFVREIGQGLYGFVFAHAVRVDPQDNIWVVDEGSDMVIKFDPEGRVIMTMGRKPEAIDVPGAEPAPAAAAGAGRGGAGGGAAAAGAGAGGGAGRGGAGGGAAAMPACVGAPGDNFNRPSDVAWDAAGNIFVADGYVNTRVAKFDKNGKYIKCWGQPGNGPGQFNVLHSIATDAQGNVYVGDRENRRIQVFDNDGNFTTQYLNVGAPFAICITPGAHQYLYSSNSNYPTTMDDGEIYKMELNGKIVGKFGRAGKLLKEFGSAHEIDCRNENELYVGEITNWRVQKLTLKPTAVQSTNAR